MGFLSQYEETAKIDLKDGYFVEVRVFLSSDARYEAERRLTKIGVNNVDGKDVQVTTDFDQGAFTKELAAQALLDWNLTDANDRLLPFGTIEQKRASIGRLPKNVVDLMVSKLKEQPDGDDGDRGPDFRAEGDGGAPAGASGAADSGGVSATDAVLD